MSPKAKQILITTETHEVLLVRQATSAKAWAPEGQQEWIQAFESESLPLRPQLTKKIRWQLTQSAFDKLLGELSDSREIAADRYLLLRKNLVRFFEHRHVPAPDEAADEVLNRLCQKLEAGERFENIGTYALGIARFVCFNVRRAAAREVSQELPERADLALHEDLEQEALRLNCLNLCLRKLPKDSRDLIVAYYQGDGRQKSQRRQNLATELGIPLTALRNRSARVREKLEHCLRRCLIQQ